MSASAVKRDVEFTFYSGFSDAQKKRCVRSLHQAYLEEAPGARVLEVSSRSPRRSWACA